MRLKIKQLVAWIGGKDRIRLLNQVDDNFRGKQVLGGKLTEAIPVSFVGHLTQETDELDYLEYGKSCQKSAYPFLVEVTSFSQEPFPLRLLLDIMVRAQAIREEGYKPSVEADDDTPEMPREGYYAVTKDEAAARAVIEILGTDYEFLARFIALADHWWNESSNLLRNEMNRNAQADRPE